MAQETNLDRFKEALLATKREGMADLIGYLIDHDFHNTPCSGSYHLAVEGGLLEHSLNVYNTAKKLVEAFGLPEDINDSVTIAALLHDVGKIGQFDKPNYVPNILKTGQSTAKPYKTNPELLPVDHEIRSIAIISLFVDLTEDEQFAILYHNGLYGNLKYAIKDHETELYLVIHTADMFASRFLER